MASKLDMTLEECAFHTLDAWQIEANHRGLKQNTGNKHGQFRLLDAQKINIAPVIQAFVRLEIYRLKTGISRLEDKQVIIRQAIRANLKNPTYILSATAYPYK